MKFNERHQGESESFESFVTDLKILVEDCDYQEEERMVRDAIFFRRKYTKVREKCLDLAKELTPTVNAIEKTKRAKQMRPRILR